MFRKIKKLLITLKNNLFSKNKIFFISEPVNWVIEEICKELINNLRLVKDEGASLTYSPIFLKNKILHFASIGSFVRNGRIRKFHTSNKTVVSWYHVLENDSRIFLIPEMNKVVDIVHTACKSTKEKLIAGGFDRNKVILIEEGIDLELFKAFSESEKLKIKQSLNIPDNKMVIGSFQKDGVGWGEGLEPKLEKGPDIFCDVVEVLSKKHDVHVLLTGPSRGYVKNRLDKAGVSYTHHYLKKYSDIAKYYRILDVYLITSRVEGGPKALLESWASGVPLVSTRMGMCADIVKHLENGLLSDVEDVSGLLENLEIVISDKELKNRIVKKALDDVKKYSWKIITGRYFGLIFNNLK